MNTRTITTVFAALLALAFSLTARAEPVKLKFQQISDLSVALAQLDGTERAYENVALPNGQTTTRILRVPYDLKTAVRIGIARNIATIKTALEAFEAKRQSLLAQVSPGSPEKIQNDPQLLAKFIALWNESTKEPLSLDLVVFAEDDLNLEKNKDLANATIAGLSPLLAAKK